MTPSPGWQQPALRPKPMGCLHLGAVFASLTVGQHASGHEWICTCGKRFVVVSDAGRNKRLVPRAEAP